MTDQVDFEVAYSEHEFVRGMIHATSINIALSSLAILLGFGFVYFYAIREPRIFSSQNEENGNR